MIGWRALHVRMDSWLPDDTFRRGGFGHVLRGREHVLIVERGISLSGSNATARRPTSTAPASIRPKRASGSRHRLPTSRETSSTGD